MDKVGGALRLTAVDEAAAGEGLAAGMTLADAHAQVPRLAVRRAAPAADLALLERLAEACRRYTPALALRAPDGVDLDVTGCTGLHGGEAAFLQAAQARFAEDVTGGVAHGFAVRAALADTPGLAFAAARFGQGGVVAVDAGAATLAPLPTVALGLPAETVRVLESLGLRRIGQVLTLPRSALARRLGEDVLHRLDAALDRRADPLESRPEPEPPCAERRVFEPLADPDPVLQVVADLADDLAERLARRGRGGRRFALDLYRVDGAVKRLQVRASRPLRDPRRIADLFTERLAGLNDGLEADFGFDRFRLSAGGVDRLAPEPRALLEPSGLDAQGAGDRGLGDLADRLSARAGAEVARPAPADVHAPERAAVAQPPAAPAPDWGGEPVPAFEGEPLRPLRLFDPPQPVEAVTFEVPEGAPVRFTWRRVARTVVRAEGPERLEPQWALEPAGARVRDYYRLEDETGRRYWLFREGRYDAPDLPPPGSAPLQPRPERIKPVRAPPAVAPILLPRGAGEAAAPTEGASSSARCEVPSTRFAGPPPPPPGRGEDDPARQPVALRLVPKARDTGSATLVVLPPPIGERLGFRDAPEGDEEGEGTQQDGSSPPPAAPRWFLHGLFG